MKIKLQDVSILRQELNGVQEPSTGKVLYKGLLTQEIHFKAKYHLTKLSKEIEKESELLFESEKDLYKKHFGETEPEKVEESFSKEEISAFLKNKKELYDEEIEIQDLSFSIDDFDFKSSEPYATFSELFLK